MAETSGEKPAAENSLRSIDDEEAEAEIRLYLAGAKAGGKLRVELLEIVYDLELPPSQIQKVMSRLCAEGVKDEPGCELYKG